MKSNDWKDRLNVVYSTNPDFNYECIEEEQAETLPKNQQKLRVGIEKKGRGGKTVTIIKGFIGSEDDLKDLSKWLKTKCGVGGSAKEGAWSRWACLPTVCRWRCCDPFRAAVHWRLEVT